jgi:hypothetical protein
MPTTERERYRQALVALAEAQRQARRAEIMAQIALNRVRQAEEEGFEAEAAQREVRRRTLTDQVERDQAEVLRLAGQAEAARILAVGEEIDEIIGDYDAALLRVLAEVERLAASIQAAAGLAERAGALAATLPESAAGPRRLAAAATEQVRAINRAVDRLATALTEVDLPRPSPPGSR